MDPAAEVGLIGLEELTATLPLGRTPPTDRLTVAPSRRPADSWPDQEKGSAEHSPRLWATARR